MDALICGVLVAIAVQVVAIRFDMLKERKDR